jgi:hypothetical protein
MTTGYNAAVEALGELILEQKNALRYKDYEIESLRKQLDELKTRIREFELNS